MKTLLAFRHNDGIGDWMMTMSILKMVNLQYPDILIDVGMEQYYEPQAIHDVVDNMNVICRRVSNPDPDEYDYYCGKVGSWGEWRGGEWRGAEKVRGGRRHLIKGMIENFNLETGLNLQYDQKVLAQFTNIVPFNHYKPYIVMPSCGRQYGGDGKRLSGEYDGWATKTFGEKRFAELAKRIKKHYDIIQVGASIEPILDEANRIIMGRSFAEVVGIMRGAEFCIGEINGLMHLAGHHGIKYYAIYCGGSEHPEFTSYENQVPTWGISLDSVYITLPI